MRLVLTTVLLAPVLLGTPRDASPQSPALTPAVEARERAFAKTMADRDFDAFLSFISPEAVFFGGNGALRGRDAIVAAWRGFFEGPQAPFSWEPDVVEVLDSGGLALTSGPVRLPSGEDAGRFNSIWRLDSDGVWRIVFDRGS
jgi:ketosteroid isomerase-like protein